jgi:hypothetical protein
MVVVVVVVLLLVVSVGVVAGGGVVGAGAVVLLGVVVVVVLVVVSSFLPQAEKAREALSATTMVLRRIKDDCMLTCSCWGKLGTPSKRPFACPWPKRALRPRRLHPCPRYGHTNVWICVNRQRMLPRFTAALR